MQLVLSCYFHDKNVLDGTIIRNIRCSLFAVRYSLFDFPDTPRFLFETCSCVKAGFH